MQEIVRKNGQAIQPEEELLRVKLERFINELNAPMKYRVSNLVVIFKRFMIYTKRRQILWWEECNVGKNTMDNLNFDSDKKKDTSRYSQNTVY